MANGTIAVSQLEILTQSGTGIITVVPPTTNTNRTLTLPDNTGTVVSTGSTAVVSQAMLATNVAGNGPAFSAYPSGDQSFSASTWTKVNFATEEFDTNSNFTSSRFTPTTAGYYQINTSVFISFSGSPPAITQTAIYKNGSGYRAGYMAHTTSGPYGAAEVSDIIYLNGSTDYVEVYVLSSSATAFVDAAVSSVPTAFFSGAMVRAA